MEGVFGTGRTAYGLDRVMARLPETAFCVIGVALLLMNLTNPWGGGLPCFLFCSCSLICGSYGVHPI